MGKRHVVNFDGKPYHKAKAFYASKATASSVVYKFANSLAWEDWVNIGVKKGYKDASHFVRTKREEYTKRFTVEELPITVCPHCQGEMKHIIVNKKTLEIPKEKGLFDGNDYSHIYSCYDCPNVMLEFCTMEDYEILGKYLKGETKDEQ
jgi:hypothetical protein